MYYSSEFEKRKTQRKTSARMKSYEPMVPITIDRKVIQSVMNCLTSRQPETGGILLGPIGSHDVTDFYFDQEAVCSSSTYSPTSDVLNRMLKTQWRPRGLDMKGFAHSHPNAFDQLSKGDLIYIQRLLQINPEDEVFITPIIIPEHFRMVPWVVLRNYQNTPVIAKLNVI